MKRRIAMVLTCVLLLATLPIARADGLKTHYEIALSLDVHGKSITGTATVNAVNDSREDWPALCLRDYIPPMLQEATDVQGLSSVPDHEIHSVTGADGSALAYSYLHADMSTIYVELPAPLKPGEGTCVTVAFSAAVPRFSCARYGYQRFDNGSNLFSLSHFYPVLAVYEDGQFLTDPYFSDGEAFYSRCAAYDVYLTLPSTYTVASTGRGSVSPAEDGMATWHLNAENVRDFTISASDNFSVLSMDAQGVEVLSYHYKSGYGGDHELQGEIQLQTAVSALELFSGLYGPYPYETLSIVQSADDHLGVEYPALLRVTDQYAALLTGEDDAQTRLSLELTIAHEVAHQWFYAVVGNNQYREAWLDEGFARYSEYEYITHLLNDGGEVADQQMRATGEMLDGFMRYPVNSAADELDKERAYAYTVYENGALFLYRAREVMGADAFIASMRDYYKTYAFKEATTADFVEILKKHAPAAEGIDPLIDEFIAKTAP